MHVIENEEVLMPLRYAKDDEELASMKELQKQLTERDFSSEAVRPV